MTKLIFKTLGVFIVLGILFHIFLTDPAEKDMQNRIHSEIHNNFFGAAETDCKQLLRKDGMDIDMNHQYVYCHYSQPEYTRVGKSSRKRDDDEITAHYDSLIHSTDSASRDLGYYFRGLCYSYSNDNNRAYDCYQQVKNKQLKYLNNSLGYYFKQIQPDSAVYYFKKEICIKGNLEGSVSNLMDLYLAKKNLSAISGLQKDSLTARYIDESQLEEYYLLKQDVFAYLTLLYQHHVERLHWFSLITCLLIAFVWLGYLRYIDLFEPEKWYYMALMFGLSVAINPLVSILYELMHVYGGFQPTGNWWNDLLYCLLGIGLVEESVKLLPLFLFLFLVRKAIDEPIDYVIYACVSALGFAFVENLLYLDHNGFQISFGRALSASVAHMACSSIVAYGFVVARYKLKISALVPVFYGLLAAAAYHGLYDYWLVCEDVSWLSIVSTLVLISLLIVWKGIQNNALNYSPYFDRKKTINDQQLIKFLFVGLMAVLVVEFTFISIDAGPSLGRLSLIKSVWEGGYLMFVIITFTSSFKLKKDDWKSIEIWKS